MKFACTCGALVFDAGDALPTKGHLIPDEAWFATLEAIEASIDAVASGRLRAAGAAQQVHTRLITAARPLYTCRICGRLYVTAPDGTLHGYVPEPPVTPGVLRAR